MQNNNSISILGSGWLGLPLAEYFVRSGYRVNASTRSKDRLPVIESVGAKAHLLDIENQSADGQAFLNSQILVINITSKNIEAFESLILEIEKSPIEKILFVSSSSVYKNLNRVVREDEGAEDPESILFKIETLFRENLNFDTTVLRLAGLIGNERHPGRWFKNKKISQADAPVNLIHRNDCIGIIGHIVEQDIWGEVFNAVADTHPSKREFYTHVRQLLSMQAPGFSKNNELEYKVVSNQKSKCILNYRYIYPDLMEINFD